MTARSPSQKSFSRRHNVQFFLPQVGRWLNWLSVGLSVCWLLGRVLGRFYFFELFSHFQVQYVWLAYALMTLQLLYRLVHSRRFESGAVLIPFALLGAILYFKDSRWAPGEQDIKPANSRPDVRVFHANVLYTRNTYDTTIALIRQQRPDVYVLQEMTPQSIRLVTSVLKREFPYWFACWSKGPCWVLAGSRKPIRVDQALARKWRVISLKTQVQRRDVALLTVHPRTPILPSWFRERNDQLTYVANAARQNATPTVLIGDFNISVFSPIYTDLFESPTQPVTLLSARRVRTQPTWPRFFPPMMIPIDHAFVNGGFYPQLLRTLEHPGSDHKALVVDLRFAE
ncbi:endonuclease/exonuclease/phosphatase family protein [Spirosoma fluminis]